MLFSEKKIYYKYSSLKILQILFTKLNTTQVKYLKLNSKILNARESSPIKSNFLFNLEITSSNFNQYIFNSL